MQKESCGLQNIIFTRKKEFPALIMYAIVCSPEYRSCVY